MNLIIWTVRANLYCSLGHLPSLISRYCHTLSPLTCCKKAYCAFIRSVISYTVPPAMLVNVGRAQDSWAALSKSGTFWKHQPFVVHPWIQSDELVKYSCAILVQEQQIYTAHVACVIFVHSPLVLHKHMAVTQEVAEKNSTWEQSDATCCPQHWYCPG